MIYSHQQKNTSLPEKEHDNKDATKENKTRLERDVTAFASHLLESTFLGKSDAFIKSVLTEALVQLSNRHKN